MFKSNPNAYPIIAPVKEAMVNLYKFSLWTMEVGVDFNAEGLKANFSPGAEQIIKSMATGNGAGADIYKNLLLVTNQCRPG